MINTDEYCISAKMSLVHLTYLIFYYKKINKSFENRNKKLKENLLLIEESNRVPKSNEIFKKFYKEENFIKVSEIICPDIVGMKEYIGYHENFAYNVETRTPTGLCYVLNYESYNEIIRKNYSVKLNNVEMPSSN